MAVVYGTARLGICIRVEPCWIKNNQNPEVIGKGLAPIRGHRSSTHNATKQGFHRIRNQFRSSQLVLHPFEDDDINNDWTISYYSDGLIGTIYLADKSKPPPPPPFDMFNPRAEKGQVTEHRKAVDAKQNLPKPPPQYRQYLPPVPGTKQAQSAYLRLILDKVLQSDKWRCKLIKMCHMGQVNKFERVFPESSSKQFAYVGAGSYAHVYRCTSVMEGGGGEGETSELSNSVTITSTTPSDSATSTQQMSGPTTIIKLIDVYSEQVIKCFNGTSARSSVSTYKDAYNEFKVSLYLSYLNTGLDINKKYYKCCTFPDVYKIYVVDDTVPRYFDNSSKIKQIDYGKLFPKPDEDGDDSSDSNHCRSRPSIREIASTKPEIAIIEMEDCGLPIGDILGKLRPFQILSLAKQLLLGFMIAEKVFEFEHRDLHLGNIMVKECKEETLSYLYSDKIIYLPSHQLQTKVIDTTFSRLKYKSKVFYRNLSHLFNEKDMDKESNKSNPLSHQDQTYRGMAFEIKNDWPNFYPKSNLIWSIYIMKKFLYSRPLRKDVSRESSQVRGLLRAYVSIMFGMNSMHEFFSFIYQKPELNRHVPIKMEDI